MNRIFRHISSVSAMALAAVVSAGPASAAIVPFTENFVSDNANWKDAGSADLSFVGAGGPDASGYVTTSYSFENNAEDDTPVLLRGQDNFNASSDAFVGNWLAEGITEFSAYVRHDAPVPLNFFTRFASPFNFPGGVAVSFVPVLPNTWTKVTFDISAFNPQFVSFEGSDFNTVLGNVGNVQLGVSVTAALAGSAGTYTIDLDQPTITPEPATLGLFSVAGLYALRRRADR